MDNCIFCKIVNKEIPSAIVFENEDILCFKDINPVAPVHILVIPKKHLTSLNDLTEDDMAVTGRIFVLIKQLAAESGVAESGYRVVVNCGPDGGQEVGHLHYHLIGGKPLGKKIG
ncbi:MULTISPECIES: histidine triad nucleotide-binding protein [Dehalobacter]|uniref:HIT domain-containing protein n=2 Tax=Dehalobacter restrictus TaxID=55583 RepID=A0A857DG03_9FIRM|nr:MULTISPECIES: histidine triad nucleotide-binding protein [Dehalobacter]AHF09207.1 HIT family hydrolase [Dehalobacter restrictus DSM 9455]MCG1025790.1 histidine triad nucleotide-binding protein [Dehalobacter sp.]MDJ0306452.1 histidine triad nucleotide-binding protein [Dehalobacter sp.]OCZ51289.1 histidine triad nucleotide-binding protein [Dehalobacter sp. TeCB1]QGZ99742.1 HIT domain-containing protein [Dehalobacter restrictus]